MSTTPFDTINDFARSIGMQAYLRADGRGGHEIVLVSPSRYMPSADSEQPVKPNPQAATVTWTGDTVRIEQGGGVVRYAKLITSESAVSDESMLPGTDHQKWLEREVFSRIVGPFPRSGEKLLGRRFKLIE